MCRAGLSGQGLPVSSITWRAPELVQMHPFLSFFFFPEFEAFLDLVKPEVRSYFPESWLWEVHQVPQGYFFFNHLLSFEKKTSLLLREMIMVPIFYTDSKGHFCRPNYRARQVGSSAFKHVMLLPVGCLLKWKHNAAVSTILSWPISTAE